MENALTTPFRHSPIPGLPSPALAPGSTAIISDIPGNRDALSAILPRRTFGGS